MTSTLHLYFIADTLDGSTIGALTLRSTTTYRRSCSKL
jgi:hypothetical protein